MHGALIVARLRVADTSQAKVAAELNVSRTAVSRVIHGQSNSKRIARYIASKLNRSVDDIWTDGRYSNKEVA